MFTRYSGFSVPQNYSGNRFKRGATEEMNMKTHRPEDVGGAVKSSVSPIYSERASADEGAYNYDDIEFDESSNQKDIDSSELSQNSESLVSVSDFEERKDNEKCLNNAKNLTLGDVFSHIKSDDLLLISLIIFLSSDKKVNNSDIILILALLLLYHD